jgi:hypothetical protein
MYSTNIDELCDILQKLLIEDARRLGRESEQVRFGLRFIKHIGNHPCPALTDNPLGYFLLTSHRVIRLGLPLFDITGWLTCAFDAQLQALRSNPTSTSSSVHTSS